MLTAISKLMRKMFLAYKALSQMKNNNNNIQ